MGYVLWPNHIIFTIFMYNNTEKKMEHNVNTEQKVMFDLSMDAFYVG